MVDLPQPGGPNRQNSSLSSTTRSTSSTATTLPKRLLTETSSSLATNEPYCGRRRSLSASNSSAAPVGTTMLIGAPSCA